MKNVIKCHDRYPLGESQGLSRRIYVVDEYGNPRVEYEGMCASIDDAIHEKYLQSILDDIGEIEAGLLEVIEEETEGWLFWIRPGTVIFEGNFGQGSGGEVALDQFKLAVSTFRDFLNNPRRDPIEIPFPDGNVMGN